MVASATANVDVAGLVRDLTATLKAAAEGSASSPAAAKLLAAAKKPRSRAINWREVSVTLERLARDAAAAGVLPASAEATAASGAQSTTLLELLASRLDLVVPQQTVPKPVTLEFDDSRGYSEVQATMLDDGNLVVKIDNKYLGTIRLPLTLSD